MVGQQLDLLDNKPALIITHKETGEVRALHPCAIREAGEKASIYDAGYLHGYADARAGRPPKPQPAASETQAPCLYAVALGG